jgi:hypothetical protein
MPGASGGHATKCSTIANKCYTLCCRGLVNDRGLAACVRHDHQQFVDSRDDPCLSPCGNADPAPRRSVGHRAICPTRLSRPATLLHQFACRESHCRTAVSGLSATRDAARPSVHAQPETGAPEPDPVPDCSPARSPDPQTLGAHHEGLPPGFLAIAGLVTGGRCKSH